MHRILDLDILLLVSGIARKHGIVPKPFSGHPQYFPPRKKSIFFLEQEISQEREFVASQIRVSVHLNDLKAVGVVGVIGFVGVYHKYSRID